MRKRILSFILVLVMMLTIIPIMEMEVNAEDRFDVINTNNITGEAIIEHAKTYLGVPYTGSTNFTYRTGYGSQMAFDCSGYVFRVLKDLEISSSKKDNCGTDKNGNYHICGDLRVQILYGDDISAAIKKYNDTGDYSDLKPGDLMVTGSPRGSLSHVVFYAGNGQIIHCEGTEGRVAIHPIERYRKGHNGENWLVDGARLITCDHKYNNVGVCTSTCKKEFNFMATKDTGAAGVYETTKKITPRTDKPYAASTNEAKEAIPKGKEVTVEYSVLNHYSGHIWYYVTYKNIKGYIYSDNLKLVKHFDQKITCEITSPTENQSLTKKAHPLIGTVTSTYPIAIINGYLDGQHFVDTKPNATTVDLRSSVINTCLDFGKLSPGKHTLELKAHDIHRKEDVSIIKRTFYIEAIGPHTCDQGEYLWVWDLHPHYKCYKCSICGEEWANKSEPTVREGCSDCYTPTYKVSLNTNGGSCDKKEVSVTDGSNIGDLPTPTLSGYTFDGWYTEPFGGSKITSSTKVTDNMTVYAHWKHAGHKIEFDFADGIRKDAGEVAQLTSINNGRPGGALVVFNEGGTTVNTNVYGWEIAVDEYGEIKAVRKYGDSTQLQVPYGGFVLSGQADSTPGVEGIFGGVLTVINIHEENLNYVYVDYETGKVYAYENYADYVANHKYVADGENYGVLPVPEKEGRYLHYWHPIDNPDDVPYYFSEYCGSNLYAQWRTPESMGPVGFTEFGDHRYEFYEYATSWNEAKLICEAKGGHLVTLTSKEEQEHIAWFANHLYKGLYYIGCSDAASEGTWTWVTGEPFSYTNWDTNSPLQEPTGTEEESYGAMIAKDNPPNKQIGEWIDAPNIKYGSFYDISNCGFICEYEPSSCEHELVWLKLITEPSLTATGEMYQECFYCDMEGNFTLPALNKFDYELSTVSPACETPGKDKYTLYYKGYNWPFEVEIPATGHKWDSGVITNAATCEVDGVKTYTCQNDKAHTKTETIPAVGHKDSDSDYICDTCNKMLCTNHSAVTIAGKAATCTEAGLTDGEKCSKCGKVLTEQEVIPALGHTPELKNAKDASCTTDGYTGDEICKTCGKTIKSGDVIKATDHKWDEGKVTKEPNETTEGIKQFTCTACKETKEEPIPVTIHKHHFKDTVVAPSCTEGGYTEHKCSCGEITKDTYTNALGHNPELKNAKDASCTTDGYTGDEICKTCDKTIKSGDVIEATGHKWDEGKVTKEPTETTEGIKQFTCTVCEETKEESIPVTTHKHHFKDTVVAPSCTEGGYTLHECSCGESYKDTYTNAFGHTPELKNAKEATCTTNGYTGDEVCKTCGKTIKSGEVIKAKGHSYANGKCSVCGAADPNYEEPKPEDPIVNPFNDVKESDWFYAPVLWAVQNNVTGGTSPNTFGPNNFCTRAQVVTFLWAANGKPEPTSMSNPFTDVSDSAWYCKAVMWAVEQGITGGTSATTFSPDAYCTRAQVATFLYAAQGKPAVQNANNEFIDVPDNAWYLNPVLWAAENGITGGIGGGKFGPDQTCTRAQIATFLYKAMS